MPHPFSGCGFFFASPSWNASDPGMRISVFPGDGAIHQSTRAQSSPRFWRRRPSRRPGGSSVNDAPRNASADASRRRFATTLRDDRMRRPDATTAEYSPLDLVKRNQSAPRQVTELTEHRGSPPLPDTARRGAPGSQKDPQRRAAISTTAFRNNANGAPIRSPAYPVATRHKCLSLPWFYLERLSSCART